MKTFYLVSEGVKVGEGVIFSNGFVCCVPTRFLKTEPLTFRSLSELEQALKQDGGGAVIAYTAPQALTKRTLEE